MPGARAASDALLTVQLASTGALAWPGRGRWRLPPGTAPAAAAATAAGLALVAAGAHASRPDFTPFADPLPGAELHTGGIYARTRNPVYAGLLVAAAGVAVLRRRPEPLVGLAVLAAVLHLKTGIEERRLRAVFGAAYDDYAARTPRLIGPW